MESPRIREGSGGTAPESAGVASRTSPGSWPSESEAERDSGLAAGRLSWRWRGLQGRRRCRAGGQWHSSGDRRGSRSLDFPAPSSALDRHRSGPSRCSRSDRPLPRAGGSTLVTLASPAERSRRCRNLSRGTRFLAEPPPRAPSSRGLARLVPLRRSLPVRPLPAARRRSSPLAIGSGLQARHRVPPAWFRTTSAAFSAPAPRVCCAPLPAVGFVAFPAPCAPAESPEGSVGPRGPSPRHGDTLRRVPLVSSRAASLRPLPSCRCRVPECPTAGAVGPRAPEGARAGRCRRNRCSGSRRAANPHVVSVHRTDGPRSVPRRRAPPDPLPHPRSRRCRRFQGPGEDREQPTPGPCSTDESVVAPPPLPATSRSLLPWACSPSKVRSDSASARMSRPGSALHVARSPR
jgi:hypothetical protein